MEIAALPSCEKSLFAGAKVAIIFYKRFTPAIRNWTVGV